MSLRLRLLLITLLPVLVSVSLASVATFLSLRNILLVAAREESLHRAEDLAQRISDHLAIDARAPMLLASLKPTSFGDDAAYVAALHSLIPDLLAGSELFNLGVFFEPGAVGGRPYDLVWYLRTNDGAPRELLPNIPGGAGYDPALPIYDYPTQEWFVVGRAVGRLVWTEPYFDAGGAEVPMVTATMPILDADELIGVATTDVPLGEVRDLAAMNETSPNSYVMLISNQGRFIAHERAPELELARTLRDTANELSSTDLLRLDEALSVGINSILPMRDPWSGAEAWVAHAAVPSTGWSVVVVTPIADALAPITSLQQYFLIASLAMLMLLSVLSWGVATWFVGPVRVLTTAAERLATGERGTVQLAIKRQDELGRLARSFEHMASAITHSEGVLEATVATRTAELQAALATQQAQARDLRASLEEVQLQKELIAAMNTPVIPLRRDTLVVPVIGTFDAERARRLITAALRAVELRGARHLILDVTGLPVVDTSAAATLIELASAVRLLGARVTVVGITPEVAQTIVALGVDLGDLCTLSTLEAAVAVLGRP